jgi:hypothetical protein
MEAALAACLGAAGCSREAGDPADALGGSEPDLHRAGWLQHPRLTECSGAVASRRFEHVLWVHNDGDRADLYAVDASGQTLGEFGLVGLHLSDWEDIAIDDQGHLFVGDIGNNDGRRRELAVHQLDEPDPRSGPRELRPTRSWRLAFPGRPFDSEALFVWQGHGYVVTKVTGNLRAQVFSFPLTAATEAVRLEHVATTSVGSPVTAADASADGRLLALVSRAGAFVYSMEGDVRRVRQAKPSRVRVRRPDLEGCAFMGDRLLATTESREILVLLADVRTVRR